MRVFYDTNVILDLLAKRPDFFEASARAISVVDETENSGFMSALTICDIAYILRKSMSQDELGGRLLELESILQIVDLTRTHVMTAFVSGMSDYEDAVQSCCAESVDADVIVTRDLTGFAGSKIRALTPDQFLMEMESR